MPRAVQFDHYGHADVLHIADVPQPEPGPGEAVVEVVAAEHKRVNRVRFRRKPIQAEAS